MKTLSTAKNDSKSRYVSLQAPRRISTIGCPNVDYQSRGAVFGVCHFTNQYVASGILRQHNGVIGIQQEQETLEQNSSEDSLTVGTAPHPFRSVALEPDEIASTVAFLLLSIPFESGK